MGAICALSTGKCHSDKRGDLLTPCTLGAESCKAASMWLLFVCGSKWFRFINVSLERPCGAGGMVMNAVVVRGGHVNRQTLLKMFEMSALKRSNPAYRYTIHITPLSFCFVYCLSYISRSLFFSISFLSLFNTRSFVVAVTSQDVNATCCLKLCIA
jgi:hypothetical protein